MSRECRLFDAVFKVTTRCCEKTASRQTGQTWRLTGFQLAIKTGDQRPNVYPRTVKGGVKTPEGKPIVKYNALRHGLLAKEAVITVGEGAENPEEFNALVDDLKTQLAPSGTLEEMLVEKVAVAYWRLRRAYRYEVGLIRNELDKIVQLVA